VSSDVRQDEFELLPAIDLVDGQVVRLRQGDFAQATVYGTDAAAVAHAFVEEGATWLHVVDLDGARRGTPAQLQIVRQIVEAVAGHARVELGGGLRTIDAVAAAIDAGVTRVVVGTAALRDPGFAADLVQRYGADRIAIAIDVRDGLALGEGWRAGAPGLPAPDVVRTLASLGVRTFAVTAIDRDGMLGGPDLPSLRELADLQLGRIVASGGIATVDDVLRARATGCAGAIVGKALYEGHVRMQDLIAALA
jgi:phosphoribosylformimino-5-aminoimidazole carboxamide ribotide isomerase